MDKCGNKKMLCQTCFHIKSFNMWKLREAPWKVRKIGVCNYFLTVTTKIIVVRGGDVLRHKCT